MFCATSLHVLFGLLLGLEPSTPYSIHFVTNQYLLFAAHAHTITVCFAVVPRLYRLFLTSVSTLYFYLSITHPPDHSHLCSLKSNPLTHSLWSPYGIGQTIIFPCLVSIFFFFYLLFSSPNLSGRTLECLPYFHTWCGLSANLECMSQMSGTWLKMQDPKKSPKIAIWAPSHNFVGLYLRIQGTYLEKLENVLSSNMSSRRSHNVLYIGPLAAEIGPVVWGTPATFNGFCVLAALLHGSQVVSISQTLRR